MSQITYPDVPDREKASFPQYLDEGGLSDFLSHAQNVRSLTVHSDGDIDYETSLQQLIGNNSWPSLRELILPYPITTKDELVHFLKAHTQTVRILSPSLTLLTTGTWKSTLSCMRKALPLEEFHSDRFWSEVNPQYRRWWVCTYRGYHVDDAVKSPSYPLAMAIRDYILYGGNFDIEEWPTANP